MAVPFNKISIRKKKIKYKYKKLKPSKVISKKHAMFLVLDKEGKWVLKVNK